MLASNSLFPLTFTDACREAEHHAAHTKPKRRPRLTWEGVPYLRCLACPVGADWHPATDFRQIVGGYYACYCAVCDARRKAQHIYAKRHGTTSTFRSVAEKARPQPKPRKRRPTSVSIVQSARVADVVGAAWATADTLVDKLKTVADMTATAWGAAEHARTDVAMRNVRGLLMDAVAAIDALAPTA